MLSRRSMLLGLTAATTGGLLGSPARATVSRALSLHDLVHQSRHRVVGTPIDQSSMWEVIGNRRRIVTYSVVQIQESLDSQSPDSGDVAIRTLGGTVGDIGQRVHGEAELGLGSRATLFLEALGSNIFCVAGMAQGHYPTRLDDEGVDRLYMSPVVPPLMRTRDAAVLELNGRTLLEARTRIVEELSRDSR